MLRSAVVVAVEESGGCFQRKTVIDCEKVFRIRGPLAFRTAGCLPENVLLLIDYKLDDPSDTCTVHICDSPDVKRLMA